MLSKYNLFISMIMAAVPFASRAQEVPSDSLGVYSGVINLFDKPAAPIPLSVSLALSGEVTTDADGNEVGQLDGAFVIDSEGGPYKFTKLTVNEIDGRVDFRYDRPADLGNNRPASFRLVGFLNSSGSIAGRVLSGSRGHIGDFEIAKAPSRHLETSAQYDGFWEGYARMQSGHQVPFHIELVSGLTDTLNPSTSEFEFTPGKVGNIRWNNIKLSMDKVVIDYLRRKVTLSKVDTNGIGPGLVIEYEMNPETGTIKGYINSAQRGRVATFNIARSAQYINDHE